MAVLVIDKSKNRTFVYVINVGENDGAKMSLAQFYGGLAIAASVFVGILTAYIVTRLSDLKSERSQLRQRIESIDAELEVLETRHDFRINKLEETEEKWRHESAEKDVDQFIEYEVGSRWNPSHEEVTVEDALDALIEYQDLTEDDLIQRHVDTLEERWEEIIDELKPRETVSSLGAMPSADVSNETYEAANWIIEALWNIYEMEKYDTHDTEVMNVRRRVEELLEKRKRLEERYESLDPKQLRDSIKSTIIPIILSVVIPLIARFLHEIGLQSTVISPTMALIEPMIVLIIWIIGFFWTLWFVWKRVTRTDEELQSPPQFGKTTEPEAE